MLEINYKRFIHILRNPDKTLNNTDSCEYKHIMKFVEHKKRYNAKYNVLKFMEFLNNGFKSNKNNIYKIQMYY